MAGVSPGESKHESKHDSKDGATVDTVTNVSRAVTTSSQTIDGLTLTLDTPPDEPPGQGPLPTMRQMLSRTRAWIRDEIVRRFERRFWHLDWIVKIESIRVQSFHRPASPMVSSVSQHASATWPPTSIRFQITARVVRLTSSTVRATVRLRHTASNFGCSGCWAEDDMAPFRFWIPADTLVRQKYVFRQTDGAFVSTESDMTRFQTLTAGATVDVRVMEWRICQRDHRDGNSDTNNNDKTDPPIACHAICELWLQDEKPPQPRNVSPSTELVLASSRA